MISLTALGGRALRIAPSAIISLAAVKHGQHDDEHKVQTEVVLLNGPSLWVYEPIEDIEKMLP